MVAQTIPIQYFTDIQIGRMLQELFPNGGYSYRVWITSILLILCS